MTDANGKSSWWERGVGELGTLRGVGRMSLKVYVLNPWGTKL